MKKLTTISLLFVLIGIFSLNVVNIGGANIEVSDDNKKRQYFSKVITDNSKSVIQKNSKLRQTQNFNKRQHTRPVVYNYDLKLQTDFLDAILNNATNPSVIKKKLIKQVNASDVMTLNWIQDLLITGAPEVKRHLIEILGNASSEEAVKTLLDYVLTTDMDENEPKHYAIRALSKMQGLKHASYDDRANASKIMESILSDQIEDNELVYAVTQGISTLGTARGIKTLFSAIEMNPQIKEVLVSSLSTVRNTEAIDSISDTLNGDTHLEALETHIAGSALGSIGTPEAVEKILRFAEAVEGQEQKQIVMAWLNQASHDESINLMMNVENTGNFKDPVFAQQIGDLGRKIDNQSLNPGHSYLMSASKNTNEQIEL